MCLSPIRLNDEYRTQVACRQCSLCRDNRLNDLIGRCIAEQSSSLSTVSVTLTYGDGDKPEAAVLYYKHVQDFLKRLRKAGHKVRYICAGEYGEKKGRAHWHIVLFFNSVITLPELERRVDWSFWPHGFSYFQQPDYKGFRYVMKYALKAEGEKNAVKSISMSKKPPLGYEFFMKMARDLVNRRIAVHSPEYAFAHILDSKGVARRYWLQGRMREMFLTKYVSLWLLKYNEYPPFTDFLLERHLDKLARKELDADPRRFDDGIAARQKLYIEALNRSVYEPPIYRHEIGFLMLPHPTYGIVVAYSDRTADIVIGDQEWRVSGNERSVSVAAQLMSVGKQSLPVTRVSAWLEKKWPAES